MLQYNCYEGVRKFILLIYALITIFRPLKINVNYSYLVCISVNYFSAS